MPVQKKHISIIGGGPAGLAYAYYAQKAGHDVTVFEKNISIGGNCITTCKDGYCWDSGAHRIHNVYPDITEDIKKILDNELQIVAAPSHIYFKDKFIPFPFNIINVVRTFGVSTFLKATIEVFFHKKKKKPQSFKEFAIAKYGPTLAQPLLLNYTQKLWGISTEKLSTQITGKRLTGLTPWHWLLESLFRKFKSAKHLEGDFYYPHKGIGEVTRKLGENIGLANIKTNSAITGIYHENGRITHIEINYTHKVKAENIVSTLPLPLFARLFKPGLPNEIVNLADTLKFRNLIIVAFAINKPSISNSASIYFPGNEIFTRIVEPKNRSQTMAPQNFTSLVVEIPCFHTDEIWKKSDKEIIETVKTDLIKTGLCKGDNITHAWVQKLPFAYPVLSCDAVNNLDNLQDYFICFDNLTIAGRNGNFTYTHIHDLMYEAKITFLKADL